MTFSSTSDIEAVIANPPDLLLLDGRGSPTDSGWDFLERLKADPRTAPIPVLVLTGESGVVEHHGARLTALDTTLVLKPFDLSDLIEQGRRRLAGEPA